MKFKTIILVNQDMNESLLIEAFVAQGLELLKIYANFYLATNPEEALDRFLNNRGEVFDLVVTDLVFMKDGQEPMSGCLLREEIRKKYPDLPVVAFSEYFVRQTEAIQVGFDEIVFKTGNYMALPKAIDDVLKKTEQAKKT